MSNDIKQIELAIQQFIGFTSAIRCNKIIDLVESMGLTKEEWIIIREQEEHLFSNDNHLEDIDNHFNIK